MMGKAIINKPFEKLDKLTKSLEKDLIEAKSKLSVSDKKEIATELKEASDIALRIINSVKE